MNLLKIMLAGAALGVLLVAFRDFENQRWLVPAGTAPTPDEAEEPVLGYDGMDEDTLLDWLDRAGLDDEALGRMRSYERSHLCREPVLRAIDDRL